MELNFEYLLFHNDCLDKPKDPIPESKKNGYPGSTDLETRLNGIVPGEYTIRYNHKGNGAFGGIGASQTIKRVIAITNNKKGGFKAKIVNRDDIKQKGSWSISPDDMNITGKRTDELNTAIITAILKMKGMDI